MIARTPIASENGSGLKDPLAPSVAPPESSPSFASSFVFVESASQTPKISRNLSRHSTVIHNSPDSVDLGTEVDISTLFLTEEQSLAVVHNVKLVHPQSPDSYTLFVTNYRIILNTQPVPTTIPLASILDIKSRQTFDVKTKDCRFFQFSCEDQNFNKSGFLKLLNSLAFDGTLFGTLATRTASRESSVRMHVETDLARLVGDGESVTLSCLNEDYSVCLTYPRKFIVPNFATREMIIGAAKFRDKGRLPVLAWRNSIGSVWRSSQPKSSLLNRSTEDEQYLKAINVTYIIDCRPMLNAYANIANAGGVESLGNYHEGIELWFASIQNIHHVRDSWEKLFLLSQQHSGMTVSGPTSNGQNWLVGLESTGWIDLMVSILRAVNVLVEKVCAGANVLCRCSHGLDRTPQVVSLGMICLDKYYRTIEGFAVLVEKEWVQMGHRFASRYSLGKPPSDETSPIFSQWIDSVYQLVEQFPNEFEFSKKYLVHILMGMLSGRFENFMVDCEKEREEMQGGADVWEEIWRHKKEYLNGNFVGSSRSLMVDYRSCMMRVFSDVWLTPNRPII
jgi:hypothetical protein